MYKCMPDIIATLTYTLHVLIVTIPCCRSAMMEGSGTLEDQLEATKVGNQATGLNIEQWLRLEL